VDPAIRNFGNGVNTPNYHIGAVRDRVLMRSDVASGAKAASFSVVSMYGLKAEPYWNGS